MSRRIFSTLISGLAVAAMGLMSASAGAQTFPAKTIRIIIPAAPGGPTDIVGRALSKVMGEQTGLSIVVENKAGASGSIGVAAAANSPPDGYTLLVSVPDAISIYPLVKKNPPYRVDKDLTPVTLIAKMPIVYAVDARSKAKTLKEFVDLAKNGKMTYSTPGSGTTAHLMMELLKYRSGMDLLHVPYKGAAPAMMSIIAGETDMTATSPTALKGFIEKGQLRGLALTAGARSSSLPDVPTMAEAGFPDFVIPAWFGVFTSRGVSAANADKLNELVLAAIATPEFQKLATNLGMQIEPVSRQAFGTMLTAESARWKALMEAAKMPQED
ncbi:MAG: tripartite tricarboxylate transporter substrate binding protein [Burkholderiaceae bacterium]|nr:tripartite tricarboxylate transporter substrate binding protein [Burkholderiaceae bacterium]